MKKVQKFKPIKQNEENDEKDRNELFSVRSDLDSTNSTIEKMQDFLEEHGVSSNLSTTDSVQPMESSSFPMDFGELQQRYKEQKQEAKKPEVVPFKKVLENRRSDFEEIRQHLERRSQEMKKRPKKMGVVEKSADQDDTSTVLSYHSTEFSPNLDCNALSFRPSESLTNKERLRILSDKCRLERSKETDDRSDKSDACSASHAIFAHLAKLKSVAKPACKLDPKAKAKTKAKMKVLETAESEPNLSLHRDSQKSVTSRTSLKSNSSKHLDD